jgi:hypothetical protein
MFENETQMALGNVYTGSIEGYILLAGFILVAAFIIAYLSRWLPRC